MERDILTYTGYVVVVGGGGTVFPASKCVLSSSRHRGSTNPSISVCMAFDRTTQSSHVSLISRWKLEDL